MLLVLLAVSKHLVACLEAYLNSSGRGREYYDLVRSKFLAFSHQLRIGGMHGLFVAYHNTDELQGFQYISLAEIDKRIFGCSEMADQSFNKSTEILSTLMSALKQHAVDLDGMRVSLTGSLTGSLAVSHIGCLTHWLSHTLAHTLAH